MDLTVNTWNYNTFNFKTAEEIIKLKNFWIYHLVFIKNLQWNIFNISDNATYKFLKKYFFN